jgi:hypothetical protein
MNQKERLIRLDERAIALTAASTLLERCENLDDAREKMFYFGALCMEENGHNPRPGKR